MKIRNDFVSNSSSSSFILGHADMFEEYHITKDDMFNALLDIYGKDRYEKCIEERKAFRSQHPDCYSPDELIAPPFVIYDLLDEDDRNKAIDRWGEMLSYWQANKCALNPDGSLGWPYHVEDYNRLCDSIESIFNIIGVEKPEADMFVRTKERQEDGTYGYYVPVPESITELVSDAKKKCGVLTNAEVLKHDMSRFFVHFDDNEIFSDCHCVRGKDDSIVESWDENDEALVNRVGKDHIIFHNEYATKCNKERIESGYETEAMSSDRVFEVLFNKLAEMKGIDTKKYSWNELNENCLTICMHEG